MLYFVITVQKLGQHEREVECSSVGHWVCGFWWQSSAMCWARNWV